MCVEQLFDAQVLSAALRSMFLTRQDLFLNPSRHSAYQDFLALGKDADPDIPILKQAQAEYAKLR